METEEKELLCVSEGIVLSDEENAVLRLHTKFSVVQMLSESSFAFEQELSYAKICMERKKDLENEEKRRKQEEEGEHPKIFGGGGENDERNVQKFSNEERSPSENKRADGENVGGDENLTEKERRKAEEAEELRLEEEEARCRQTYDPLNRIYDDRRQRVTDLPECNRVTLPGPLPVKEESLIEMRRELHNRLFREHRGQYTKMGEQISNMSDVEIRGLHSLLKRIKAGELLVLKTDKSGRFCVVSVEDYKKMGAIHTAKDIEISREDVVEIEKKLNGHSISWVKIFNTGLDHGHTDRVMSSKVARSENLADMYVLVKDHKAGNKTRPVVTGCTSNTRGLNNSVSSVLESLANSDTGLSNV